MQGSLRPRDEGCLSDLVFDEWHAGELPTERVREAESHLAGCAACSIRRAQLTHERAEFLERRPKLPAQRGRSFRGAWLGGGLAAAAAVALLVSGLRGPSGVGEVSDSGTRVKGSPRLSFFVKRGGAVLEGAPGQQVQPGDRLRFVLTSERPSHVAILSLDGAGAASVYYPSRMNESRPFEALRGHALDEAVELDAVLGPERIYAVFCERAFQLEPLRLRLEAEHELVTPSGCSVDLLELVKVPTP